MNKAKEVETVVCKMRAPLVAALDALAERQYRSRSDIVRQAVLKELEAQGLCPIAA